MSQQIDPHSFNVIFCRIKNNGHVEENKKKEKKKKHFLEVKESHLKREKSSIFA